MSTPLTTAIVEYQQTGELSEFLYSNLIALARSATKSHIWTHPDREDFEQDCVLSFLQQSHRITELDTAAGYLFSMFSSVFGKYLNRYSRRAKAELHEGITHAVPWCMLSHKRVGGPGRAPFTFVVDGETTTMRALSDRLGFDNRRLYQLVKEHLGHAPVKGEDITAAIKEAGERTASARSPNSMRHSRSD